MKSTLMKVITVVGSLSLSIAGAFWIYSQLAYDSEPIVYQGKAKGYALSFVDQKGRSITTLDGALKLMLDPFTVYRNYPAQDTENFQIDQTGFRHTGKNRDLPRLVILGGSAAFGQGAERDEDTFASILHRTQSHYDVINAAVAGYLSGQELAMLTHYFDSDSAQLYIVTNGWNEVFDQLFRSKDANRLGFNNAFFLIEDRLAAFKDYEETGTADLQRLAQLERPSIGDRNQKAIVDNYLSNIKKMYDTAKVRGASFLLVFQPELGLKKNKSVEEERVLELWDNMVGYLRNNVSGRYSRLISSAVNYCDENNIPYVDLNRVPPFSTSKKRLFYDPVHFNSHANESIAAILAEKLAVLR